MALAGFAASLILSTTTALAESSVYRDPSRPLEERVQDLLRRMSVPEKASLKGGGTPFGMNSIPRLGIPALRVTDGPNGVRSNEGEPTTAFPVGVAMAATWNPDLIAKVGQAIGQEARALGNQILLGPNVNIQRSPLAGRNFESYSEDPVLAGHIGVGFVEGVQSQGIGVSLKHLAANNQEFERMRGSSNVDERTLREIYFPAFETIAAEAKPWTVMAAYNKINGTFASENRWLLTDVLKDGWHFDGAVMSDWSATHSTAPAAKAGLDLEMPGPPAYFGKPLLEAIQAHQVDVAELDDSARRLLRVIVKSGVLDGKAPPPGEVNSERHWRAARDAAAESLTLLKNEGGILPIAMSRVRSIAVIGPNSDKPLIGGGGSAQVTPFHRTTPLEAIRNLVGDKVRILAAQGVDNEPMPPEADPRLLTPGPERIGQGLRVAYFANSSFSGEPARTSIDDRLFKISFGQIFSPDGSAPFSARWEGYFWPPVDGTYEFGLIQSGAATLMLDGKPVIASDTPARRAPILDYLPMGLRVASVAMKAGRPYPIRLDYVSARPPGILRLGIRPPSGTVGAAVAAARKADIALVFVGSNSISDTEGEDRPNMDLPGQQNALVEAVRAANPRTIVVLNNGGPLAMPWADHVPAILEAWLPGQEGAPALADALFGEINPSGKLPITFPRRLEDNPAFLFYPGGKDEQYGEGLFVGYRYYDKRNLAPLFPFGHGLSYTRFDYRSLTTPDAAAPGQPIEIGLSVRNDGARAGAEVVQLYVGERNPAETRPPKELKRFAKIFLQPGESRDVHFTLTPRDLSYWDVHRQNWVCQTDVYDIMVGSSAADIRLKKSIHVEGGG